MGKKTTMTSTSHAVIISIGPCLLAHDYTRWVYPPIVFVVICKLNLRNIANETALSLK